MFDYRQRPSRKYRDNFDKVFGESPGGEISTAKKAPSSRSGWRREKDTLHKRRKELEQDLRPALFSHDQMMMRDCKTETEENKRVAEYDKRMADRDRAGRSNEDKLREWNEINRTFKKHGEEGNRHDADQLRRKKVVSYN